MNNDVIHMVDLIGQYSKIKNIIDEKIISTINSGKFINGPSVSDFSTNLSNYLDVKHVIPCANGTDALQIAYMAIGLNAGDEIICPSWTYVATAEAAALLGIKVVFCDVDVNTFNVTAANIEPLINNRTKAIVPVHLYGQSCDMEPILNLAKKHNLKVIEDNAQAIGCKYEFSDDDVKFTGTIGHIGTTSFYPSKNLGCYGDGGAIFTNDDILAEKIKMIANHGEKSKYLHEIIGCNSRLDSIQATILDIKLKYLDEYNLNRNKMAEKYNEAFNNIEEIQVPHVIQNSTHVYHQYTLIFHSDRRDDLKDYLNKNRIPSMIYYPIPNHMQNAYFSKNQKKLINTEYLSKNVISLPIHTEINSSNQDYIIEKTLKFFK